MRVHLMRVVMRIGVLLAIVSTISANEQISLPPAFWSRRDLPVSPDSPDSPDTISQSCRDIYTVPQHQQCQFLRTHCDDYQIGRINYLSGYYCWQWHTIVSWILILALALSFMSLGLTASEYLCPNLYTISKFLHLSDNLAGLTLLALGNSSPDVLSTYKAMSIGSSDLALSELVGASLFITTVVIGSMAIIHPFKVPRQSFLRDGGFFLGITIWIFVALRNSHLGIVSCVVLMVAYVLYVLVVVYGHSQLLARVKNQLHHQRARANFVVADGMSSTLPTIDTFTSTDDNDEMESEIAGSYGLKLLLKELSKHSHAGSVALEESHPSPHHTDIPAVPSWPLENQWLRLLAPNWLDFPDQSPANKLYTLVSTPVYVLLRLTTPVRDQHMLSILNQAERTAVDAAYEFVPGSSTPQAATLDFDFASDRRLLTIQTLVGLNFLLVVFNPHWLWLLLLYVAIGSLSHLLYHNYPAESLGDFSQPSPNSVLAASRKIKLIHYLASFAGFVVAITWISVFATEIISILKAMALICNLNDDLLGVTVFAVGNSIGDFISNYTIAKMGMPLMAFGACFGGPLLAICSMGLSGLLLMDQDPQGFKVDNTITIRITSALLILNVIILLVLVPLNNWMMDRRIGLILIGVWIFSTSISIFKEIF